MTDDNSDAGTMRNVFFIIISAFFLSFNHSQSLNDVGKGFRALATHIGELFVLAFAYVCLRVKVGIFYIIL